MPAAMSPLAPPLALPVSPHAHQRSAQRSVPQAHIALALDWGQPIRQPAGRIAWHLGHRDVAAAARAGITVPETALGVTVVLAEDGTVVTVVRSPDRRRLRHFGRSHRSPRGRR